MSVLVSDLIAFAPEFTSTDPTQIQAAIDMVERRTARAQWGDAKADDGVKTLAAHVLTLQARKTQNAIGVLTGQSVGPVSRSFAAPAVPWSETWYASTNYGQEYIGLRATIFADRIGDCL